MASTCTNDLRPDAATRLGRSMKSHAQYGSLRGQHAAYRGRFSTCFVHAFVFLVVATSTTVAKAEVTEAATAGYSPLHPPRVHYQIECAVTPGKELVMQGTEIRGKEIIRFDNTTSRPMQTLAITWFRQGEQTLGITANGKPVMLPAPVTSFPEDFTLPDSVGPGESLTLEVEFVFSGSILREGPDDIWPITNWPRLWWGFPSHDDYKVKLDVPDGYTVATSGRFEPKTGYYYAEAIPSFGVFLCKGYEVLEDQVQDVLIRCLHKPENKECAQLLHKTTIDVIHFYREWLGFYPHRILTIIPGKDYPAGGYPAASSIIVIHGMGRMEEKPELHWRWITAHEIGHQYWGEHVLEKEFPGWLWIGLGLYADREYCRARNLGNQKHRELMSRYIEGVREGLDTTVGRRQQELADVKFDFNNVVVHGKGFSIISALDCVLGKPLFDRIYRRCLKEFAGRRLGLHEFRAVCEHESGHDLGWFFDQWVNSNKFLSYTIASKECTKVGDIYVSKIEVRCLGSLKMPVPVAAHFEDGTRQRTFTNRLRDVGTVRFESRSPLKGVQLDPDQVLPLVFPPPPLEIAEGKMTEAEKAAIDEFRRINAKIEKGETFGDASTPLHAVLSFISTQHGGLRKYFMRLDILRAPLPPDPPKDGTLWPVYAGNAERSELEDTFLLVHSKGKWLWVGSTGNDRDWRTSRPIFEQWAKEKTSEQ